MKTLAAAVGAALFCSALACPVTTEAANTGIAGTMDTTTGTFTPQAVLAPAAVDLLRTGVITVTTTVQIDSQIPQDQTISCTVTLNSFDSSFTNSASGSNNVIRTGNKGTCKTTIHYIWQVLNAQTKMNVSVSVSTNNGFSSGGVSHNASHSFTPFAVPNASKSLSITLAL
ncbi:MAG TPA: hypothetical protein VGF34_00725 [Stellaceae bacterium]|jgi:hypothetical protein